jgi:ParB-like chromosome segregation protein Spo0J
MQNQKMKIEQWPLEKLIHYAHNPRKNDHAVEQVAAAIREFGFKVPIVALSDGTIVDGHLRAKAAAKLDLESVPVILADDLTAAQIKAFRLSVNRMAELAEWDDNLLKFELDTLQDLGFDIALTGFDIGPIAPIVEDIKPIPEPKEQCTIQIVCKNFNQFEHAVKMLGGKKKILWEDLEAMIARGRA